MMLQKIKQTYVTITQWMVQQIRKERCSKRLSLSLAIGSYIAFSPFVGLHTMITILFAWLLALNFPFLLVISCGVNNPWTMIPIYAADHFVGHWLLELIGCNAYQYNPAWLEWFNAKISVLLGIRGVSLLAFIIGGNVLALCVALGVYAISRVALKYRPAVWQKESE